MNAGQRSFAAWVIGALAVLALALVMGRRGQPAAGSPMQQGSEEQAVKNTIEAAYQLRAEACLEENHGSEASYQAQLASYWSAVDPSGGDLATREALFQILSPTLGPTQVAEVKERIVEQHAAGEINSTDMATAISGVGQETPAWSPNDSPHDMVSRDVADCQRMYGRPTRQMIHFGVDTFTYDYITVSGSQAEAVVDIAFWSEVRLTTNELSRRSATQHYTFHLEKQGGTWKIAREEVAMPAAP